MQQWDESIQQERVKLEEDKKEFQAYQDKLHMQQQTEQKEHKQEWDERVARVTQQELSLKERQATLEQALVECETQKAAMAEQSSSLNAVAKALQERAISLEDREAAMEEREASVAEQQSTLKEYEIVLEDREARIKNREAFLIEREVNVENLEASLKAREAELKERQASLDRRETESISVMETRQVPSPNSTTMAVPFASQQHDASEERNPQFQPFDEGQEVPFVPTSNQLEQEQEIQDALQLSLDDEDGQAEEEGHEGREELSISIDDGETILPSPIPTEIKLTERERLQIRIEQELKALIQAAEAEELEEPMEEEAVAALFKGAHAVAYKKKYYDAISDEFIYFPSILRAILDYTLIEEAEKFYFDEGDEFPIMYAAVLRAEASNQLTEHDDGGPDEDYMARLATDVE